MKDPNSGQVIQEGQARGQYYVHVECFLNILVYYITVIFIF